MKKDIRLRSVISKYCSDSSTVLSILAGIGKRHIQVSINAVGGRKSKRLAQFIKGVGRMEKELRKSFPSRKVEVRIWIRSKKSPTQKVEKPFQGRDIVMIVDPTYL